jgi:hypothetical protein
MELPPGLAAARRPITIVCAALAAVAVLAALAFSFQGVGNGCGSGWAAARKPLPDPLLTPQEVETIVREKQNPYEVSVAKAKPIRECRSAGAKRLITAGLGAGVILLPVGALLGYIYYPRREELTDVIDITYEQDMRYQPPPRARPTRYAGPVSHDEEDVEDEEEQVEREDLPGWSPSDSSGWGEWRKDR